MDHNNDIFQQNMSLLLKRIKSNDKEITIIDEKEYTKGKFLGKGRFDVYEGENTLLNNQKIAIKEIPLTIVFNDLEALIQEINMCCVIPHPRVPKFFGITITHANVSLIMELIENAKTLSEKAAMVDYKQKIDYMVQLTSIIKDLHEKNIIHRDLKPLNVLVNDKNQVYLIDFGTSKFCSGSSTGTVDSKGTTYYMPPENVIYEIDDSDDDNDNEDDDEIKKPFRVSIQFDIWSLGCIISEICSGIKPWTNFKHENYDLSKYKTIKKKKVIDVLLVMELLTYQLDFPIPDEIKPELKEILKPCFHSNPKERIKIHNLFEKLNNYLNTL